MRHSVNTCPSKLSQLPYSRAFRSASGMLASLWTYMGSFSISILLSNTEDGTKIRFCSPVCCLPSGVYHVAVSVMVCMGGAAVINRSFTQPCPIPPGLAVERIYTRVPAPLGRLRDLRYSYSSCVKCVSSSNAIKSYACP